MADPLHEKLGEAIVEIRADLAGLRSDLEKGRKETGKEVDRFGKEITDRFKNIAAGFTVGNLLIKATEGIIAFGAAAVENAGNLVDMSAKTGASIEWLQRAGFVAKQTGADIGSLTDAVFKLGINMAKGGKEVTQGLADIGLKYEKIKTLKPEDQFDAIAEALKSIENPQERNRIALEIFGKSAGKILPAVLDDYIKLKDEAPVVAEAQIRALDKAADRWDKFKDEVSAATASMLGQAVMDMEAAASGWSKFFGDVKATIAGGIPGHIAYVEQLRAQASAERDAKKALEEKAKATAAAIPPKKSYSQALAEARKEVQELTAAERKNINAALELGASTEDLTKEFGISEGAVNLYKEQLQKNTEATKKNSEAKQKLAETEKVLQQLQAGVSDEITKTIVALEAQGLSTEQIAGKLKLYSETVKQVLENQKRLRDFEEEGAKARADQAEREQKRAERIREIQKSNYDVLLEVEREYQDVHKRRTYSQFEYDKEQIRLWVQDQQRRLDTSVAGWETAWAQIEVAGEEKLQELAAEHSKTSMQMAMDTVKVENAWADVFDALPGLLRSALTGGGGLSGFGNAFGSMITEQLGKKFVGSNIGTSVFGKAADGIGKLFGNKIGNAFAMAVPGMGGALGALMTPMLNKLGNGVMGSTAKGAVYGSMFGPWGTAIGAGIGAIVGAFKTGSNKTKKVREEFAKAVGFKDLPSLLSDLEKIDAKGAKLAHTARNIIGKNDEAGNKQWMEDVKKFYDDVAAKKQKDLDDEMDARERLQNALEKYGFTVEEYGDVWKRMMLADQAKELLLDFTALTASGVNFDTVIKRMGSHIQDFITTSLKTGTEVPESMRKMLQRMVETGELFDENGNKIEDLEKSGIKFSMTMSEGFKSVTDKLEELIKKITGDLTKSLTTLPSPMVEIDVRPRAGSGLIWRTQDNDLPQMEKGGIINAGKGALAVLHNREAVIPLDQMPSWMEGMGGLDEDSLVAALKAAGISRPNVNFAPVIEGALANEMHEFARKVLPVFIRVLQEDGSLNSSLAATLGAR